MTGRTRRVYQIRRGRLVEIRGSVRLFVTQKVRDQDVGFRVVHLGAVGDHRGNEFAKGVLVVGGLKLGNATQVMADRAPCLQELLAFGLDGRHPRKGGSFCCCRRQDCGRIRSWNPARGDQRDRECEADNWNGKFHGKLSFYLFSQIVR